MEVARKIWPSIYPRIRLMAVNGGDIDIHDTCYGSEESVYLMQFTLIDNNFQSFPYKYEAYEKRLRCQIADVPYQA